LYAQGTVDTLMFIVPRHIQH